MRDWTRARSECTQHVPSIMNPGRMILILNAAQKALEPAGEGFEGLRHSPESPIRKVAAAKTKGTGKLRKRNFSTLPKVMPGMRRKRGGQKN